MRKIDVDLEKSCWQDLLNTLDNFKIKDKVKINKSLKTIEFPNGSLILAKGLSNPDSIKSIPSINDIWMEEASEFNYEDYLQAKIRLRGTGRLRNQIILTTNPVSKNTFIYKHFFEDGCKEDNCIIDESTYHDNPYTNEITRQSLEALKDTNRYMYEVYVLNQFGNLGRRVYTNWRVDKLPIDELLKKGFGTCCGLDWGFNDPCAVLLFLLDDQDKKIYVINELYETGLTNPEIAGRLKAMGLSKTVIICDSSEPKSVKELQSLGITKARPCQKGAGSIMEGIHKLQEYEIIVDEACVNTIQELENYTWKKDKKTGEYYDEPEDAENHLMDCLRYGCQSQKFRLKTLDKGAL